MVGILVAVPMVHRPLTPRGGVEVIVKGGVVEGSSQTPAPKRSGDTSEGGVSRGVPHYSGSTGTCKKLGSFVCRNLRICRKLTCSLHCGTPLGGIRELGELLFGALWAEDIGGVGNEALTDERLFAHGADEAVVVPVPVFEGDEAGAPDTCDGAGTSGTSLGEQLAEAVCAVGFVLLGGESLPRQRRVAVGTGEALAVPGLVLVRHPAGGDDLTTLDAPGGELLLVAGGAVDLLFSRDEALGSDGGFADDATEALFVPLPGLVLHLLVSCPEDLPAAITACGEGRVVARPAVDFLHLAAELLVHQRDLTFVAQEAFFVPVLIFVRQVLGIDADDDVAVVTGVCEHAFVALGAVGMVVLEHVALARQTLVALPAAEVLCVPVLGHRLRVLAADAIPLISR